MARVISLVLVFILIVAAAAAAEIPQGAHMLLRMENSINTRTAQEGDFVYLRTASPIAGDGRILVPVGSYVQGVVTYARRSGRVAGRAELAIRLEALTFPNGSAFKFSPHLSSVDAGETGQRVTGKENTVEQGPDHGADAGRIAILAGSGAALGALVTRGGSAGDLGKAAGIGGGAGAAVGLATVLLTRGKEVELRHGATLDVRFDRPVALE